MVTMLRRPRQAWPAAARRALMLLALALSLPVHAADALDIGGLGDRPVDLADSVSILEDPSASLSPGNVAARAGTQKGGFMPATPERLHPGVSSSAWWLRLRLSNNGTKVKPSQLVLSLYGIDELDFYVYQDGRWRHALAGQTRPQSQHTHPSRLPGLPLTLSPGEQITVLVRARHGLPLQLRPYIYSHSAYQASESRAAGWDSLLFGGLLALGWASLVIVVLARSATFLALSLLTWDICLLEAARRGYGKLYLWPEAVEWSHRCLPALQHAAGLLFALFVLAVARRENMRLPGRRMLQGVVLLELAMIVFDLVGDPRIAAEISTYSAPIYGLVVLAVAVMLYRSHAPTRRLMLLVAVTSLAQMSLKILEKLGMLPEFFYDLGPYAVGTHPLISLLIFYINLTALSAWIHHVGWQRNQATRALAQWQQQENQRLEDEVARQTQALNQALQYADEKNRQKTEILGYIGHDLRTPLATIVGYARLLAQAPPDRQAAHVDAIVRSANYQMTLIDELLNYARNELKPLELVDAPADTAELLDDVVRHAALLSAQHGNRFQCEASGPLPETLLLDGRRMRQALLNLLSNAAKFTHDGLVSLRIAARPAQGAWLLDFTVSDSGEGIDASKQSVIFDAFEQARPHSGGVGLGLFIAQSILRGMGSELRLHSRPGEGSVFSFQISVSAVGEGLIHWQAPQASPPELPAAPPAIAPHADLPAHERMELAVMARDGRLTDIEGWLARVAPQHAADDDYFREIQKALQILDLERIESLALAQA